MVKPLPVRDQEEMRNMFSETQGKVLLYNGRKLGRLMSYDLQKT